MKAIVLFLAAASIIFASDNSTEWYIKNGYSSKVDCKYGLLIEILISEKEGRKVFIERQYCNNRSSWDGDCISEPLRCKEEK